MVPATTDSGASGVPEGRAAVEAGVLVEVEPDRDGGHDADAAEHDPGPGGPAALQGDFGGADVEKGLPPVPDGGDTGHEGEEEAQQPQAERGPGAAVDRVRGRDVGVGVDPGVRSGRKLGETAVARA